MFSELKKLNVDLSHQAFLSLLSGVRHFMTSHHHPLPSV